MDVEGTESNEKRNAAMLTAMSDNLPQNRDLALPRVSMMFGLYHCYHCYLPSCASRLVIFIFQAIANLLESVTNATVCWSGRVAALHSGIGGVYTTIIILGRKILLTRYLHIPTREVSPVVSQVWSPSDIIWTHLVAAFVMPIIYSPSGVH